jgi:hypothetical protein
MEKQRTSPVVSGAWFKYNIFHASKTFCLLVFGIQKQISYYVRITLKEV